MIMITFNCSRIEHVLIMSYPEYHKIIGVYMWKSLGNLIISDRLKLMKQFQGAELDR